MKQHLANNSDQIGSFRLFANSYSSLLYYFCQFTDMGWHQSDKNELFLNLISLRRVVSVVCTHCHQSLLPTFPEINSFQPSAGPSSFSKAGLIRITKQHHGKFSHPSWLSSGWTAQGHPIGWTRLPFLRHSVPLSPGSAPSLTSPADPLHACLLWDGPRTLLPFLCPLSLRAHPVRWLRMPAIGRWYSSPAWSSLWRWGEHRCLLAHLAHQLVGAPRRKRTNGIQKVEVEEIYYGNGITWLWRLGSPHDLLPVNWRPRRAGGVIPSDDQERRHQRAGEMDVPAQAKSAFPIFCFSVLVKPSVDWVTPSCLGEGSLHSVYQIKY